MRPWDLFSRACLERVCESKPIVRLLKPCLPRASVRVETHCRPVIATQRSDIRAGSCRFPSAPSCAAAPQKFTKALNKGLQGVHVLLFGGVGRGGKMEIPFSSTFVCYYHICVYIYTHTHM